MAIGIDLGASAIKLVELTRTAGGFRMLGVSRRYVGAAAKGGDVPRAALKEACPNSNVRRDGWLGLTGRDLNLRVVFYAKTPPANYRKLVGFELAQQRETQPEFYIDSCTLRTPDLQYSNYLTMVGSIRREWMDPRLAALKEMHIDVREAVPNGLALYAAYRLTGATDPGAVLLVDLGAENMEIAIVRQGALVFAKNVTNGARIFDEHIASALSVSPSEAEAVKVRHGALGSAGETEDTMSTEVRPVLRGAASQIVGVIQSTARYGKTQIHEQELRIEKVYLSGGGARLRGLPEYLKGMLGMELEILDPFKAIDLSRVEAAAPGDMRQLPTDLTCAIGLAALSLQASDAPVMSLVPDAVRTRREFRRTKLWLAAAGAVAATAMLVLSLFAGMDLRRATGARDDLRATVEKAEALSGELESIDAQGVEVRTKSEWLRASVEPGRVVFDSFVRLRKIIPDGLKLTGLELAAVADPRARTGVRPPGRKVLTIRGEVSERLTGGPADAIARVADVLRDEERGVEVSKPVVTRSDQHPGWHDFMLKVEFGPRPPAEPGK